MALHPTCVIFILDQIHRVIAVATIKHDHTSIILENNFFLDLTSRSPVRQAGEDNSRRKVNGHACMHILQRIIAEQLR